jgi:hypothetical protein
VIHERNVGDISAIMKKLLTRYAMWFNKKYTRSGALFAGRYKSECVNSDPYMVTLIRYIHYNPVKAGISSTPSKYAYSSYHDYVSKKSTHTDTDFFLEYLSDTSADVDTLSASNSRDVAVAIFKKLHKKDADSNMSATKVEIRAVNSQDERDIHAEISQLLGNIKANTLSSLPRKERDDLLVKLRSNGYSIRQIERATGVSRGIIARKVVEM